MPFVKLVLVALIFCACNKLVVDERTKIVGHAAMGLNSSTSIYADNSYEAIQLALSFSGCSGVELDLQLDKQGQLWCYHDELLDTKSTITGCINDHETATLNEVHYETIHREKLVQVNPNLLNLFSAKLLFLDIRHLNACKNEQVNTLQMRDALLDLGIEDKTNIFLITNNLDLLDLLSLNFNVFYASDNCEYGIEVLAQAPACKGLIIRNAVISSAQVKEIQAMNKEVAIFEVRSPKGTKSAFEKAPDYLLTDELRTALALAND